MAKEIGFDVGHKLDEIREVSQVDKKKICYPTVYLSEKELPLLEDLEVGDKVSFLCLFEVVSKEEREDKQREESNYTLELQKVIEEGEGNLIKGFETKVKEFFGEHKEAEIGKKEEKDGE